MVDRCNLGLQLFVHLVTLSKTLIDAVYILDYIVYFGIFYMVYFGLSGIQNILDYMVYKKIKDCTTRINLQESADQGNPSVAAAIKDIKKAIQVKRNIHENHKFVTVYLDPALTEDCLKKISYDSKKKINTLKIFSSFFISVCQDPAPNWRNIQPPSGPLAAQGRSGSSVTSGDLNIFCKFLKGDIQEKHCSNVRWGLALVIIFSVCSTSFVSRLTGLKLPPCHPFYIIYMIYNM